MVTIRQLREMLNRYISIGTKYYQRYDDIPVKIVLDIPSVGGRAFTEVKHANYGMDWDNGLYLTPKISLVGKENNQKIFEAASDLLLHIATKPTKNKSGIQKEAINILLRYGYTEDQLQQYTRFFHRIKE